MAKATIELPNGTQVIIEGTVEEVNQLLLFYGKATENQVRKDRKALRKSNKTKGSKKKSVTNAPVLKEYLNEIVNYIKNCDEAETIDNRILDRTSQVNRILLPLYIVHEHMDKSIGLTSGDVNKITTDLGVPISRPNASHTLSGTASKYVMGDKVRKMGQSVSYKITRRGLKYMKQILEEAERE